MRYVALTLCLWLLGACGGDAQRSIAAKDYDRTCASVDDCFAVYEGVISCCSAQPCPNAAIRQDKVATYQRDLEARMPMCANPTPGTCLPQPPCSAGRVACTNGVCTLE